MWPWPWSIAFFNGQGNPSLSSLLFCFHTLTHGRAPWPVCGTGAPCGAPPPERSGAWSWHCPGCLRGVLHGARGSAKANGASDGRLIGSERLAACAALNLGPARPSLVLLDLPVHSTGRLRPSTSSGQAIQNLRAVCIRRCCVRAFLGFCVRRPTGYPDASRATKEWSAPATPGKARRAGGVAGATCPQPVWCMKETCRPCPAQRAPALLRQGYD